MCRVIGRILIFVFGLAMIVLGISEMIYFFTSYINYISPTEIAISIIQGLTLLSGGIGGFIVITRVKRAEWMFVPAVILLGLGIYYFAICNVSDFGAYYLTIAIFNTVFSVVLFVSAFWNRKRF